MPITREQWIEVESATYELWDLLDKDNPDFNAMLYNVKKSTKSQENHLGIGSMGQMSPWTGTVSYAEFKKGFEKGYRHAKYSSGIQAEEELYLFEEYDEIAKRTSKLNESVYKTLQAHGVSTFNNAFDSTFAGPDEVALCSETHDYSPSDGTHQSNTGTYSLTPPNLRTVYNKMLKFVDDKGDMSFTMPTILLTGIEYDEEAEKICGPNAGSKEPGIADNDANILKGRLTHIFHPLITGKKWFLIDGKRMKNRLYWYNALIPKIKTDGDFDTEVQKFKVVGLWSYGYDSWDFLYGCEAS
jgi:hypothetical protein